MFLILGFITLSKHQNFVKSHHRPFEHILFLFFQGVITKDGLYSYEDGKKKQPQKTDEDESQAVVSAIIGTTNENNQIEHHGGGGEPCQNP